MLCSAAVVSHAPFVGAHSRHGTKAKGTERRGMSAGRGDVWLETKRTMSNVDADVLFVLARLICLG